MAHVLAQYVPIIAEMLILFLLRVVVIDLLSLSRRLLQRPT
jgi:hypothetical protein